jgi:hypothetical protein
MNALVPVQPCKKEKKINRCLSCGTTENMGRKRYCSADCRLRLRLKLDMRTGLIQALNTRYATFYFSDRLIIMDLLPFGSNEVFSFFHPRTPGQNPADAFSRMANLLGDIWWAEKRRTNKRYMASRMGLEQAIRNDWTGTFRPEEIRIPAVRGISLIHLKLERSSLESADAQEVIKSAYRRQAKTHHPDMGGDAETFRRIHAAYEELLTWTENPTFMKKRGFPDKWFYDGYRNKWLQPSRLQRTRVL